MNQFQMSLEAVRKSKLSFAIVALVLGDPQVNYSVVILQRRFDAEYFVAVEMMTRKFVFFEVNSTHVLCEELFK